MKKNLSSKMLLQLLLKLIVKTYFVFSFQPFVFCQTVFDFSFSFFIILMFFFSTKNQFVFATRFNSILSFFFNFLFNFIKIFVTFFYNYVVLTNIDCSCNLYFIFLLLIFLKSLQHFFISFNFSSQKLFNQFLFKNHLFTFFFNFFVRSFFTLLLQIFSISFLFSFQFPCNLHKNINIKEVKK